jgi:hypothetical protein
MKMTSTPKMKSPSTTGITFKKTSTVSTVKQGGITFIKTSGTKQISVPMKTK